MTVFLFGLSLCVLAFLVLMAMIARQHFGKKPFSDTHRTSAGVAYLVFIIGIICMIVSAVMLLSRYMP